MRDSADAVAVQNVAARRYAYERLVALPTPRWAANARAIR